MKTWRRRAPNMVAKIATPTSSAPFRRRRRMGAAGDALPRRVHPLEHPLRPAFGELRLEVGLLDLPPERLDVRHGHGQALLLEELDQALLVLDPVLVVESGPGPPRVPPLLLLLRRRPPPRPPRRRHAHP